MPFYDLRCLSCNEESNIRAAMEDKANSRIPCPHCGSTEMETVYMSAPAYIKTSGDSTPVCPSSNACGNAGCRFAG